MYLGIDIGGTKTLLADFDDNGTLGKTAKFPTSKTYSEFLQTLEQELAKLSGPFKAAGVGVPGTLDRENGVVIRLGNLDWKNKPIQSDISNIAKCPVVIENDAKMGGLSETMLTSKDYKKVLYLTIGTGIGIAIIEDGVIDITKGDSGGNSIVVEHDGKQLGWEDFAAGPAIVRRFGKQAREITDPADWQEIASNLAVGIKQLLAEIKPDVLIIGGGVGAHFDKFGKMLKQDLKADTSLVVPPIFTAQRPEEAVIYGCYELIKVFNATPLN